MPEYFKLLLISLATVALLASPNTAHSAIRSINGLSGSDFAKCETPDIPPDDVISYCAAMLKMNIPTSQFGAYGYPRKANQANYALHSGLAFQRKGEADAAQKYFNFALMSVTELLRPFPDDAALLAERCWIRTVINSELNTALADCDHSLRTSSENSEALRNKGFVLYRQGKYRDAITSYDASLQLSGDDAYCLFLRGAAKQKQGDVDAATDIEKAIGLNRMVRAIFSNYGVLTN